MSDTTTHDTMVAQTEKAQELLDYFQGHRDTLESDRVAHSDLVQGFVNGARQKYEQPYFLDYDGTILHSKTSLALADDPDDDTQTVWWPVPSLLVGANAATINSSIYAAVLNLARGYAFAPGFYENPQYGNDTSTTRAQFVLAGSSATTADINTALALSPTPILEGRNWGNQTARGEVPILNVGGVAGQVFARFKNIAYPTAAVPSSTPPQPVATHGGNAVFALDRLTVFTK